MPRTYKKKTKHRAPTVSDWEASQRVEEVATMLLVGLKRSEILTELTEKWAMTPKGVSNYFYKAYHSIQRYAEAIRTNRLDMALAQRMDLYVKTLKARDYRTALETLKDLDKLLGSYPIEKNVNFQLDLTKLDARQLELLEHGKMVEFVATLKEPKQLPAAETIDVPVNTVTRTVEERRKG